MYNNFVYSCYLSELVIRPQVAQATQGHPGWAWFVKCPGLICLAARWSGPATFGARSFGHFLDYTLRVWQSLLDLFLLLGKFHWFPYLRLSYFFEPSVLIYRWISNFMEKAMLQWERWRLRVDWDFISCLLPCVLYCMEGEFKQIIMKLQQLIADGVSLTFTQYFLQILGSYFYPIQTL